MKFFSDSVKRGMFPVCLVFCIAMAAVFTACTGLPGESPAVIPAGGIDWEAYASGAAVESMVPTGHQQDTDSVAWSPDGKYIATGGNREIKIWNVSDRQLIRTIYGNRGPVDSLQFSPDGRYLLSSGRLDGQVRLWNPVTGASEGVLHYEKYHLDKACFSPDGETVIAAGEGNRDVVLLSRDTGQLIAKLEGHTAGITALAVSPDGRRIAAGAGGIIRIWNAEKGEEVRVIEPERKNDFAVLTFSPDSRTLAGGQSSRIGIWSVSTGELVGEFSDGHDEVKSVRFSPDGNYLASLQRRNVGRNDSIVKEWDLKTGGLQEKYSLEWGGIVFGDALDYSPDGGSLAAGLWGRTEIWNTGSGEHSMTLHIKARDNGRVLDFHGPSSALAFFSSNKLVLWNILNGSLRSWSAPKISNSSSAVFSPDGTLIAVPRSDRSVGVWDTASGSLKYAFEGADAWSLAFSADGRYLAFGGDDGRVSLRDLTNGETLPDLNGKENRIDTLQFGPESRYLYGGDGTRTYIWNMSTMTREKVLTAQFIAFSSENGGLALRPQYSREIQVYSSGMDLQTGVISLNRDDHLKAAELSPTGRYLSVRTDFDQLRIYETDNGALVRTISEANHGDISFVKFVNDDYLMVLFSYEGMKLYRISDGEGLELRMRQTSFFEKKDGAVNITIEPDWFARDNRGRFDASSHGYEDVKFVRGMQVREAGQFWDTFFTPGLIPRFLGTRGEALPSVEIVESFNNVPIVTISQEPTGEGTVLVTVTAVPRDNGVGEIFLLRNGRRIDDRSRGLKVVSTNGSRTFRIALLAGENILQGGAYDQDHTVYGLSETIRLSYNPPKVVPPDMYILAIGVGDYLDGGMSLGSPDDDAKALAELFSRSAQGMYRTVETTVLTNGRAERERVLQAMDAITAKAGPEDAVLVFFAGHGYVDQDVYYFLPYDTDITDLKTSAISIDALSDFLRKNPAGKVAVFLDTCQSGSAVKALGTVAMARSIDERRQIANLAKARGVAVFSASAADQKAYEIPQLRHGIFTYGILDAFHHRQSEISEDGNVSLGRLLATVNSITRETAYRYLQIEQSPAVYQFGDDFFVGRIQ